MIVRRVAGGYILIRQGDHARLSGDLARLWGAPPWAEVVDPRVILAARLHDIAWEAWDENPARGDGGHPLGFPEVDRVTTTSMYTAGVAAMAELDLYAGLLVSLHYSGFFHGHWDWEPFSTADRFAEPEAGALRTFVAAQLEFQVAARSRLGITDGPAEARLEAHYKWLQLWDRISLDMCRWDADAARVESYPTVPPTLARADRVELRIAEPTPDVCQLDPFPLRPAAVVLSVPEVFVTDDDCVTEEAFRRAWRTAVPVMRNLEFTPARRNP